MMIAYIVLSFVGVTQEHSLMLGDAPHKANAALVHSSMARNFAGGYIEYLATLLFLVGGLAIARLLRGASATTEWLSSCISAGAVVYTAITIAVGFSAGAAALYDGHHGATLATATAINDIRNFGFFLSGGAAGLFALGVAGATWVTRALPRWVAYTGFVIGTVQIAAIPAARTGFVNPTTLLGFAWLVALGVAALRQSRRVEAVAAPSPVPATV
jgi:hypothetical protein